MIELSTFGATELRRDGTDVRSVLSQPKRLALLVYLRLAAPGGFVARDRLLALFWPESDPERARNALRQSLHFLRRSLGDAAVVSRADREVGVDASAVGCDAVAFLEALDGGRLEEAVELYRGEFLPGFFVDDAPEVERWIEDRRAELARRAGEAAWSLSEREAARGEGAAGLVWARRALSLDPLSETAVRRLMELHARAGERGRALEAYRELERRLAAELGVEPSPETRRAAAEIRAGAAAGAAAPAVASSPAASSPVSASPPALSPAGPSPPAADVALAMAPPAPWIPRRPRAIAAATALVVLAGAAVILPRLPGAAPPLDPAPSVAVLPFLDVSAGGGNEYFSDGITEELLNVLARVPGLRVAARTSSFAFRGKDVTVDSIARALDVSHVLEGSVRTTGGNRVRITAQLIETRRGFHLWSETYDRELGDIFEVQDEIAAAIAKRLQIELAGNVWGASERETVDPEAYRLVLRALHSARTPAAASYATSVALLEEAIQRDPGYARAYGALANIVLWQGYMGLVPAPEAYARADSLARRGLAIGESPEAHLAMARIAEAQAWNPDSADAHYRRAFELNPADARILNLRAHFLARAGRGDEAVALGRRATELDPLHPASWVNHSAVLSTLGREEEALTMMERARIVAPEDVIVLTNLANQYGNVGRLDDALATAAAALAIDSTNMHLTGLRVHLLFRAGRPAEALPLLADLETREGFPRIRLASLYEHTGDAERVLDLLEQSAALREEELTRIRSPDLFRSVRDHPRFTALLKALESGG